MNVVWGGVGFLCVTTTNKGVRVSQLIRERLNIWGLPIKHPKKKIYKKFNTRCQCNIQQ